MASAVNSKTIKFRPNTYELVLAMLAGGLFLDPPLAGIEREQYSGEASALLETATDDLLRRHVIQARLQKQLRDIPSSPRLIYSAVYEFLTSTATFIAHTRHGKLCVDVSIAKESIQRVDAYLRSYGFANLYWLYGTLSTYFNLHVIRYYGIMTRREFVLGQTHRPWISDTLEDELYYLESFNLLQQYNFDGVSHVALTQLGNSTFDELHHALEEANYLARRAQLLAVSHFDSMDNIEALQLEAWPHGMKQREHFLVMTGIRPGMKVLEAGIGTGVLTIDCGLADLVLPAGHVTGIDISAGMIERATQKAKAYGLNHVHLMQADVERLPFGDDSFDCSLGYEFLHYTNPLQALGELKRVTRPGGVVATAGPVLLDLEAPFFQEWFAPLLRMLRRRRGRQSSAYMLQPFEIETIYAKLGFQRFHRVFTHSEWVFVEPKRVIQYVLQGVSYFRDELLDLPWRAKEELVQELYRLGVEVCAKYPLEARRLHLPGEYVIGIV
ncbi:MAG: methyltransferase domain-containing protein [Firmicutes bacterium]|nr:methyltransferase domain-containing protein [Bacillota bacterium]